MTTLDEKLQSLRNVDIFATTPHDVLIQIAAALIPVQVVAGETVFDVGDPGDSLYVIAEGRVRVHDGDLLFNYLEVGDFFGEMAVLDSEERSASVTAVEDTRLFRLDQAHLYRLMAHQVQVARGIIQVLCKYLRDRLADQTRDFAYIQQMNRIMAVAQALEIGDYGPDTLASLDEVAQRPDALGNLARVFENMAREVYAREQRLKQQVAELRIEVDRTLQVQQVAEITGSDYFQELQQRARAMRKQAEENR